MIHGVRVGDPYRWLEERTLAETETWIRRQQRQCADYFSNTRSIEAIRSRVANYLDVTNVDQPARVGGLYFFRRRDQGMEQACLYVRDHEVERRLVDPANRGPFASVGIYSIARSGRWLAYESKLGGEDQSSVHILNVETGKQVLTPIERGYKRGLVFSSDGSGFFYCQEVPGARNNHNVLHHSFQSRSSEVAFHVARSDNSRLVIFGDETHLGAISIRQGSGFLVEDLWVTKQAEWTEWRRVYSNHPLPCDPFFHKGRLFVLVREGAGSQLIELALTGDRLRTLIASQEPLTEIVFGSDIVCATFAHREEPLVRCWTLNGDPLPDVRAAAEGSLRLLPNLGDGLSLFLGHTTINRPPVLLEFPAESKELRVWHEPGGVAGFGEFHRQEANYLSEDGTDIPITLLSTFSIGSGEPRPAVMTGYGGFGVSSIPQYSVFARILLELGVVLVLPQIRGGGGSGGSWHEAARKRRRGIAIEDFVAAARWICTKGITTPERLAITGGSNGGLLVAAAMVQEPNLFCAVLSIAPLLDMVRYERFDTAQKWQDEFGSVADAEDFRALYSYSPYHRVQPGTDYPPVLFVTGDRDQRCNPAHVRKMAARLQDRTAQRRPIIVDYHDQRGHAPVLPVSTRVNALARRIAFLCREMGLEDRWETSR
jgi:prolyl oligopeptidase